MKQIKALIVWVVTIISFNLPPVYGFFPLSSIITLLQDKNPVEVIFEQKKGIEEVLDPSIVEKMEVLAQCESGNRDDIVIVDTNGYRSYGKWQFQLATFRQYAEKYGLVEKGLSNDELRVHVLNGDLQAKVVYRMLTEDLGNLTHWKNCTTKHSLG